MLDEPNEPIDWCCVQWKYIKALSCWSPFSSSLKWFSKRRNISPEGTGKYQLNNSKSAMHRRAYPIEGWGMLCSSVRARVPSEKSFLIPEKFITEDERAYMYDPGNVGFGRTNPGWRSVGQRRQDHLPRYNHPFSHKLLLIDILRWFMAFHYKLLEVCDSSVAWVWSSQASHPSVSRSLRVRSKFINLCVFLDTPPPFRTKGEGGKNSNPQTDIQVIFRAVLFRFFFSRESILHTCCGSSYVYTPGYRKNQRDGIILEWGWDIHLNECLLCSSLTVVRICVQLFCFPRAMATGCGGRLVPTTAALMFDLWWHVFSCEKVLLCQERKPLTACVSSIMNGILSETGADRCGLGSSLKVEFWGKNIESCSCRKTTWIFFVLFSYNPNTNNQLEIRFYKIFDHCVSYDMLETDIG